MSDTRQGYSDRINHALAFATKYRAPHAPQEGEMTFMAHPANVAVILARHGATESTIVAGIVHHVIEASPPSQHRELHLKIQDKFGHLVLDFALDACEPYHDDRGAELAWLQRKRAILPRLTGMSTPGLDIYCADEIHQCGTAIAIVERLGSEYLAPNGLSGGGSAIGCYDDLLEALGRRVDWPSRAMWHELHALRVRLELVIDS